MGWFKRQKKISDEELLARSNPLLTAGQWEEMLSSRRSLHRRRTDSTSREFRKEWKFILFGALLGAAVIWAISFIVTGVSIWRIDGYQSSDPNAFSMIKKPDQPLLPIFLHTAWAAGAGAFIVFVLRRLWRRR